MQSVDLTTLSAACSEIRAGWLPARLEQAYQRDRTTVFLGLRTFKGQGWLAISWHPQAARLHLGAPPPRDRDTFTFSDQLRHLLKGLALVAIAPIAPWERALDLQFAKRPGEAILWHLYVEIMGKRSNAILANGDGQIVTAAHQVSEKESSVRPVRTGDSYAPPPLLTAASPSLEESRDRWRDRIALIPGKLGKQMVQVYRGLSPALIRDMTQAAALDPDRPTDSLSDDDWQRLFQRWQEWLQALAKAEFFPQRTDEGYSVLPWQEGQPAASVQVLLDEYYTREFNRQQFQQLHHQLRQKIASLLQKQRIKAAGFEQRLQQSDESDTLRQQADLLMAHLQAWQPGMRAIALPDFETGEPVNIPLDPEKNAVQNAQALYRRHQKLKRARKSIEPLLAEVRAEERYLEQVDEALTDLDTYRSDRNLLALEEIREELVQQGYFGSTGERDRRNQRQEPEFYRYQSPSGFEILVGRNNRQNDILSFRVANDYDLWFHAQEIAGSHVLLRLPPGAAAEEADLQTAANCAARHSRGRLSEQVPVVYTKPKHVYKPKGAKPGMVVYQQEKILWGYPLAV